MTLTLGHTLYLFLQGINPSDEQLFCKKLSKLVGVSVNTLHLYDKIDLLKPSIRTEAREPDFPLKDICTILDDPAFDLMQALEGHKVALLAGSFNNYYLKMKSYIFKIRQMG